MGTLGGLGPSACPRRNLGGETGILGQSHGPGAKQTQKRGFGVTGASRSQNWAGKTEFRAQNGLRSGDPGLIPRPRSTTRSEPGIWGRTRDPGAKRAQKWGFWGSSRAPLAAWAENGEFWGRRVPGPRRYLLCWLTFSCLLLWGEFLVFKPFFGANCPFWGESRRFWHCHCGEGRETTPNPPSPTPAPPSLRFGGKSRGNGSKAPPPPQAPCEGAD